MFSTAPDEVLDRMAGWFQLLGDPTRLALLRSLMTGGELNVGRLVAASGRTQSNVSKHLKQMTRAGLLARRKEGLQVYYRLTDPLVEQVCRTVSEAVQTAGGRPGFPSRRGATARGRRVGSLNGHAHAHDPGPDAGDPISPPPDGRREPDPAG